MSIEPEATAPTPPPSADKFERLAALYGIGPAYNDFKGDLRHIATTSKAAILGVLGVATDDVGTIEAAIGNQETVHWMRMLPPAVVATVGQSPTVAVSIPLALKAKDVEWSITLEDGTTRTGSTAVSRLEVLERGVLDKRQFVRAKLELPADLPLGYHSLGVTLDTGLAGDSRLIVAPATSFEPQSIHRGERAWGIAVQLYSLRSSRNWGMGDFRDLRELVELAAPLGCGIIGLNPLHALMPANPAHISPYSPSSREFLNVLYIAIEDVPEFADCEAARKLVASAQFQASAAKLRETAAIE